MSDAKVCASRDEFLKSRPRRYKNVTLPSGMTVRIQSVTELERAKIFKPIRNKSGEIPQERTCWMNACWIVFCVVDEAGNRLLTDRDLQRVGEIDGADGVFLSLEIAKHCGMSEDDDFEELAKNSETTTDGDSPSD